MRTSTLILVLGFILSLGAGGCSESTGPSHVTQSPDAIPSALSDGAPCGDPLTTTLYAAKSIDVGQVIVMNSSDALTIQIEMAEGWVLAETHVEVAGSLEEIPQNRAGNPKVGHFDQSAQHDPSVSYFEYDVDITYEPGQTFFLAVHAVVQLLDDAGDAIQEEGAWADGFAFPGKNWATYFNYTVQSCETTWAIAVSLSADSVCRHDPLDITWAPASWESIVRIELLRESGDLCSTIVNYTEDSGSYTWDAVDLCDDGDAPGTYRIRILDLDTGAAGESSSFSILDCGGWEE